MFCSIFNASIHISLPPDDFNSLSLAVRQQYNTKQVAKSFWCFPVCLAFYVIAARRDVFVKSTLN